MNIKADQNSALTSASEAQLQPAIQQAAMHQQHFTDDGM